MLFAIVEYSESEIGFRFIYRYLERNYMIYRYYFI